MGPALQSFQASLRGLTDSPSTRNPSHTYPGTGLNRTAVIEPLAKDSGQPPVQVLNFGLKVSVIIIETLKVNSNTNRVIGMKSRGRAPPPPGLGLHLGWASSGAWGLLHGQRFRAIFKKSLGVFCPSCSPPRCLPTLGVFVVNPTKAPHSPNLQGPRGHICSRQKPSPAQRPPRRSG